MPTTDNVCLIGSRWPHTNIFAKQKSHDRDGIYRMLQECQLKLRLDEERSSLTCQKVYGLCNASTKHVLRSFNNVFSVHMAIFMRVGHVKSCLVYY